MANSKSNTTRAFFKSWLLLEMGLLFIGLPLLLWTGVIPTRLRLGVLIGMFLAVVVLCLVLRVSKKTLGLGFQKNTVKSMLIGSGIFALCLTLWILGCFTLGVAPFPLIERKPGLMLMIACFYWISALAQEFLFRSFFFARYSQVLDKTTLLLLNAALFGFVHIIYGQWQSVVLSAPLGLLLAWMYQRDRSLIAVTFTHYLFGLLAFAGGLGVYFYLPPR